MSNLRNVVVAVSILGVYIHIPMSVVDHILIAYTVSMMIKRNIPVRVQPLRCFLSLLPNYIHVYESNAIVFIYIILRRGKYCNRNTANPQYSPHFRWVVNIHGTWLSKSLSGLICATGVACITINGILYGSTLYRVANSMTVYGGIIEVGCFSYVVVFSLHAKHLQLYV